MIRKSLVIALLCAAPALGTGRCVADLFVTTDDGVFRLDASGNASLFADSPGSGGLAFDANGDLFVARGQNILKYSGQTGQLLDTLRPSSGFISPSDMIFGPDGNLFVAVGRQIRRIGTDGSGEVTLFSNPANNSVEGLDFDADGNLLASLGNERLLRLTTGGQVLDSATIPGSVFSDSDLVVGPSGHIFVTSFSPAGGVREFSANLDDLGILEEFSDVGGLLNGLAFDGDTLYVARYSDGGIIYRLTDGGQTVETFATGLNNPTYLAFSPTAVPEPASFILVGLGLTGLGGAAAVRRRARSRGR